MPRYASEIGGEFQRTIWSVDQRTRRLKPSWSRGMPLTRPDASGECTNGGEAQMFVEQHSGMVFRCYRESQLAELHGAEGLGRSEHERATDAVALVARKHADLRGMADSGRNLAGEHGPDQVIASWLTQHKGSTG